MLCSIVPINALVGASDNVGIFYTTEEKVYAVEENLIEDSISNDNISETSSVQNESMNITTENDSADSSELQNADNIEESDIQENGEGQEILTESDETMIPSLYSDDNQATIQSDEESEEPENDNWELGLIFYDSSVDNGKTPLTEIDWDASDGSYKEGTPRVITVQINYKNTNSVATYQPGEVKIDIDGLLKGAPRVSNKFNRAYLRDFNISWIISANDDTHKNYDWNYNASYTYDPLNGQKKDNITHITFTNANIIEEKSNFEGNIQIVYTLTPNKEGTDSLEVEPLEDECLHTFTNIIFAEIKGIAKSNNVSFDYKRIYIHPWKKFDYKVKKEASKISSFDNFPDNAQNYIWVKYNFSHNIGSTYNNSVENKISYPYIYTKHKTRVFKDTFPSECIVYNEKLQKQEPDENNTYTFNAYNNNDDVSYGSYCSRYIYVGYPKDIYNEEKENLNIQNTVELWGIYYGQNSEEKLSDDTININLGEFDFRYDGELYANYKYNHATSSTKPNLYDKYIKEFGDISSWYLAPEVHYIGKPITVKIGDDLLYATNQDGNYVKLTDNDYYVSEINWLYYYFLNNNNAIIESGKYECELWVRYANTQQYVKFESFKNPSINKKWEFTNDKKVSAFYFLINDMKEGITVKRNYGFIDVKTCFMKKDIPEIGKIYNFSYLQIYFKDNNDNLVLQNEPELDSYNNFITNGIANYDMETHGTYMQRAFSYNEWIHYILPQLSTQIKALKNMNSNITQDLRNEKFIGSFNIKAKIEGKEEFQKYFLDEYDNSYAVKGFKIYDLLPFGMECISTEDEIIKSLKTDRQSYPFDKIFDLKGNEVNTSWLRNNIYTDVVIKENWKNTGRTKIEIVANFKEPIYINKYKDVMFSYNIFYSISYNSFLEYGNVWTNSCYVDKLETQKRGTTLYNPVKDTIDINEDGNVNDNLSYSKSSTTITSIVSTHQDVQKSVKTDQNNYSTGTVKSSYDSEYEYKLRVRIGQNDVINLVIYDSIEEYAQNPDGAIVPAYGDKKHWNGEFLGIDTSYAESKGYRVKVYYSEDVKAGNLVDDSSWKEYSEAVDKSKVKSLAFEYLDAEGNPAKLPANSLTYVLIKMKSPADENITSLAYNGCRTQWNALDDYDRPVDFITGINSNIVKVSLPNSVEDKEVNIHFNKIISSENESFEKLKLNKDDSYNFYITLENQDTGDVIKGLVNNKDGLTVNNVPIGTYIIRELDDIWFKFVNMALNDTIDGIGFKKENGNYIVIINASVEAGTTANINITNKTDDERFYDNKHDVKNLFNPTT